MSNPSRVLSVREGWHGPGYRDPEVHFETDQGAFSFRLSPQSFVELHDMLCAQQACIDDNLHDPIDFDLYPYNTRHVAQLRKARGAS